MKKEKLVSVIVPVYNVEKYLDACIDSIVSQTYLNLEIILVDDGSTDSCGKKCNRWAEKHERISVIHKTNGGLSDARNAGIDKASGEFLLFIDSDDMIDKRMVEKLLECFVDHPQLQVASCGYVELPDNTPPPIQDNIEKPHYMQAYEALECMLDEKKHLNVVAWNKLYRAECFKTLRYPKGINHEDMFVTPQILFESKEIAYIDTPLYYHRYNPNSIVHARYTLKSQDELLGVDAMYQYIKANKLDALLNKVKRIYLWKLIDHYCKTTLYIKEDKKKLQNRIKATYKNIYQQLSVETLTNMDRVQFLLFRWFPSIYYVLRKGKYVSK